jgi:hypothetical protein
MVLQPDGRAFKWVGCSADGKTERLSSPPGPGLAGEAALFFLSSVAPESLL